MVKRFIINTQMNQKSKFVKQAFGNIDKPCRQTICINRKSHLPKTAIRRDIGQVILKVVFKQPDTLVMLQQALTRSRRDNRFGPNDQGLAQTVFQQLDPLRYRRLRQAQFAGRLFKAGMTDHFGTGLQQFIIQHGLSLIPTHMH